MKVLRTNFITLLENSGNIPAHISEMFNERLSASNIDNISNHSEYDNV
jgi:hypothetical protein